ncbi:MAG TPA: aminotransferase class I/II-fold pyridoxal phosphate-dependent enzyme [Anaeromyxobacteraceae bacterium]|nr:aminotransferase class I/II-fold pyridoxal phosphate-dependent enzyme [Anaeromyxobacteraceae bacterium]
MADLFDKCAAWKDVQVAKLSGHYPYYRVIEETEGTEVVVDGKRLIMACSNNYLGLANDRRVMEAASQAALRWGSSTCGSRLLNGTLKLHDELDHRLAKFLKKEAAVVFSTGFQTNVGTISSLVLRHDLIFADRMVHASLVEGMHAAYGETKRFRHNNMEDLDRLLGAADPAAGKLIVVDGVYSMEGDCANLPAIVALKKKHGARLMVDEAHGFGVMGAGGRGTGEHFGVHDEVDLVMATFSKSLASIGGVIAGRADVLNWIRHKARALVFSASMTPPAAAAALKALDIIEQEPERRERLWDISERVHRELRSMGFDTSPSVSPVVPVVIGDQAMAFNFWRKLTDLGLFASPVVKPAVEHELVRTVFMATHTDEQIDRALGMFQKAGRELGIIPHEKPHTRVEVKMARPGATGFYSSLPEGKTSGAAPGGKSLDLLDLLARSEEPWARRLSDAAELLTWKAVNAGPEDWNRLRELPWKLWEKRRQLPTMLVSVGMNWMAKRQQNGKSQAED